MVLATLVLLLAGCGGVAAQTVGGPPARPAGQPAVSTAPSPGSTPTPTPAPAASAQPGATPTPAPPPPPPPPPPASVQAVGSGPYSFSPASLSILAGTRVTFTNSSDKDHTFTANNGAFDSGDVIPGGSYTYTFNTRGSYSYYCTIHPYMTATINVR